MMPSYMAFELLTPEPLETRAGAIFDYNVTVFGLKNRWTTYIHDYDPPHRFTDIQLKGPNSYWHHTHEFKQTKEGTLIIDNIRFLLPLGWVGKLGYHLVMKHIVKSLFNYRTRVIQSEFTFLSEKKSIQS